MDDRMTLAALRVRAGYTQAQAGEKIGVTRDTIANWEKNSTRIPVMHVEKLVNLYQAPEAGIYFGDAAALSAEIQAAYQRHVEATRKQIDVSEA